MIDIKKSPDELLDVGNSPRAITAAKNRADDAIGVNEDQKCADIPDNALSTFETSSDIELSEVLDQKNQDIDSMLDVLSSHISMIPTDEYAKRVIELCQLSYIQSNQRL